MKRILLCNFIDGRTEPTHDGLALLIGVNVEHMRDRWIPETGLDTLPTEWKRSKTARVATGTAAANFGMSYWAVRDWGARIDHDPAAGQTWAVID